MNAQVPAKRPRRYRRSTAAIAATYSCNLLDSRGFTLVELLTVIMILAAVGMIARPALAPSQHYKLTLAANEVADALRFARGEALGQGEPHGIRFDPDASTLMVFRSARSVVPPSPKFDIYHPISKQPYKINFESQAFTGGITLLPSLSWSGTCNEPATVYFDSHGTPRCANPWSVRLLGGSIQLQYGKSVRYVGIDQVTGRVQIK